METTDNHTPTPEELTLCIEESAVRAADACEQSPAVLRVDGSVIGTLGNFSASIGKAKSKKTFNVAALTAAALTNGSVLHYRASFPEEKRGILYIDTEQGRPHCQQVLRRILRLAGLPEERDPDNLVMLTLRKFPPDMRLAIVDHAIGTIPHLGLVIIDGIRDLLYDINSPKEATDIISRFMQWTDDRQIHIHTILHQNKNKAETVMQIEVDKEERSISVVEAIHIRDREFEPFAFRINSETLPELVEPYQPRKRGAGRPAKGPFDPARDIPEDVHRAALDDVFAEGSIGSYREYQERLKEGYERQGVKFGSNHATKVAAFLREQQMVIREDNVYRLNPDLRI